ncbi:TfoX/Sxy family protein [Steroidobacter agaridevorans]|nr:TfoX/Sxy family protein [Steroidobacter agaridevorans]
MGLEDRKMTRRTSKQDEFVEFVLEQMASAGQVRARRMFGGYGIYLAEHFVAIILNEKLFLKTDDSTQPEFEARGLKPLVFRMKTKQIPARYFEAPPEVFDDPEEMTRWLQLARTAAVRAKQDRKVRRAVEARSRGHKS